ncbi:recombinase RecT [Nocardioides sp. SOB77]|uniref:Recombinase RecT n=1 Tax=Nocardioides oceani TaxID=3058369 RepID=A0ABT8FGY5_9ACTN|nr:recombinase RecT [Nocardioides oceani]MDN4173956.1 recombinase RecT [Nocardioides oceani]
MTIEQANSTQIGDYNASEVARYLGLNPNNPADQAMVAVCRRYDLDPVLKHVIVIPKGGVYVTRDGLLHIAHRSGQLDGIVVEQDPVVVDGEWVAKVSVYRKDMGHPFTYPGRYSVNGGNKQYAQEMALKAAEAHALRRAFAVTGIPAYDEQRPEAGPRSQSAAASSADRMREAMRNAPVPSGSPVREGSDAECCASGQCEVCRPDLYLDAAGADGITSAQLKKMGAAMREAGLTDRQPALDFVAGVIGREVSSRNDLTKDEASLVIDALERDRSAAPDDVVDAELVSDGPGSAPEPTQDADALWDEVVAEATERGIDAADDFSRRMGGLLPDEAGATELTHYLELLRKGVAA